MRAAVRCHIDALDPCAHELKCALQHGLRFADKRDHGAVRVGTGIDVEKGDPRNGCGGSPDRLNPFDLARPAYAAAPRVFALSPIEDQLLGALIMWIPGGIIFYIIMTVVFFKWNARGEDSTAGA